MQGGDAEASVAGAFVVLPHGQRRTPQRAGLFGLERLAVELLGEVGGDHLEDPSAQDPQCLRVVVLSQRHQVGLGGRRCSVSTANSPVVGSRSRAATMARAWAVLTRPSAIAAESTSWRSTAWARRRSERASRRTCRVSTAIQSAAVPAPVSVVAPERSASARSAELERLELCLGLARGRSGPRAARRPSSTRAVSGPSSRAVHVAGGRSRAPGGGGRPAGCS